MNTRKYIDKLDGKLNTVVKDPANRNSFVLETFVKFGAPEQILYENKPHIGTDVLIMKKIVIIQNLLQKNKQCKMQNFL